LGTKKTEKKKKGRSTKRKGVQREALGFKLVVERGRHKATGAGQALKGDGIQGRKKKKAKNSMQSA